MQKIIPQLKDLALGAVIKIILTLIFILEVNSYSQAANLTGDNNQISAYSSGITESGNIKYFGEIKVTDLIKMTNDEIINNRNIYERLYSYYSKQKVNVFDKSVDILFYKNKFDEFRFFDNVPGVIYVIRSGGREVRLSSQELINKDLFKDYLYKVPKTKYPVILIMDYRGGNGWNNNMYYVISLDEKYFLNYLGKVTGCEDLNHDGFDELYEFEDVWESNGYLCHADSPGAYIIMTINNGKLKPDIVNYIHYYQELIKNYDENISKYSKEIPKEDNEKLLSIIMDKFLIYRLIGNIDKAWSEFDKDIKYYDKKYFYLNKEENRKILITEIKNYIKESLEERNKEENRK